MLKVQRDSTDIHDCIKLVFSVFSIESVELLAAVAEIDADQTPPCCLEIAQLCGRCESILVSISSNWSVCSTALSEHSRKFGGEYHRAL